MGVEPDAVERAGVTSGEKIERFEEALQRIVQLFPESFDGTQRATTLGVE
jgi:hypothetical protein